MEKNQDIFCKIINKELPADLVAETNDLIAIKDKYPQAEYHFLIIPKQHIENIKDVDKANCYLAKHMFQLANKVAKENNIKDFKLVINNGYDAGQRVFHLHMHLLAGKNIEQV